ncbi:MAG TPA: TonB-dependent receptor [Desulfatiglandales bacterium]|nr:TonB-dependent receptor [Desulfatiglandales bacterium]
MAVLKVTDWMRSYFLKAGALLCSFLVCMFALCHTAAAQSEYEMQVLRMFYREKDLVVSPTRHPKPISQVAENIAVITAQQIEELNAHTVAEVLNRVPGLFVNFNQDFGATSLIHIQGSEPRHVLVLLDGVQWNFLASNAAETNSIPVGIIERIEVIKGPASSAWGSSLGGVINIITKPAGNTRTPKGSVRASYGKSNSQDHRAEASGKAGSIGYYLFAGKQKSDGLMSSRGFDNYSFYSKLNIPFSKDTAANLSIGYSEPDTGFGDFPSVDIGQTGLSRNLFVASSFRATPNRELNLEASFQHFKQRLVQTNNALGLGFSGPAGDLFSETTYDEETTGGGGKLVWTRGMHAAVFGIDISSGNLDQTINAGSVLQSMGVPATSTTHPDIDRWAVYANDTIVMDRWSITPGIRYDDNSVSGSFLSPSLGITCRLDEDSVLRASVAKGFTLPPLSWTSGGGLFLDPNPALDPEEVWSYQAGFESSAAKYLWIKGTVFRHELNNALTIVPFGAGPPTFNDLVVNNGEIRRQGLELEAETLPVYNLSLLAGFAYVDLKPENESGSSDMYSYNLGIRYDDGKSFRARLCGHYIWWDLDGALEARYDDFIWDLNLIKRIYAEAKTSAELFLTAHNIFKGAQYTFVDSKNPDRWIEAGIRVKF